MNEMRSRRRDRRAAFRLLPVKVITGLLVLAAVTAVAAPANSGTSRTKESFHTINDMESKTVPAGNIDSGKNSIIAKGASLQLISRQFLFTEGPAADKKGNVYFTDQPNDKIWRYSVDGQLSVFMEKSGRSNGMYFDKHGNLLSCADEHNQIWSISPSKKVKVLMTDFNGKLLNGPNDLWVDQHERIYFTDPYYQRPYWSRNSSELNGEKLYYLPPGHTQPVVMDDTLVKPNGIIGTPDGKFLYVADIGDDKTYTYEIQSDGRLVNRKLFVNQGSDGMTLDEQGNIYLTGNGVTVYNHAGEKLAHIDVPEKWTGNICFMGKERDVLFITASEGIYSLKMNVKGAR